MEQQAIFLPQIHSVGFNNINLKKQHVKEVFANTSFFSIMKYMEDNIDLKTFNQEQIHYLVEWFDNPRNTEFLYVKEMNKEKALKFIQNTEERKCLAIVKGNEPIGCLVLNNLKGEPSMMILVDEKYQNQGYGTEALKLIEKKLKKMEHNKIVLGFDVENIKASALYKKLGYKEVRKIVMLEKEF